MAFEFAKSAFFVMCGTLCAATTVIVIIAVGGTLALKIRIARFARMLSKEEIEK